MHFHHLTPTEAWSMPLIQAQAYCAWAAENNGFCAVERVTDGYIAMEAQHD
jgi:hypothetical protein